MEDINLYRDIGHERNPASHTGKKMTANRLSFEDWDKALGILVRSSINAVENELTRRGFLIQNDLFTRKPVGKGIVVFQLKGNPWASLLCSECAWIDLDSEYRSFSGIGSSSLKAYQYNLKLMLFTTTSKMILLIKCIITGKMAFC
jgi:hypothetical protein